MLAVKVPASARSLAVPTRAASTIEAVDRLAGAAILEDSGAAAGAAAVCLYLFAVTVPAGAAAVQ